MAISDATLIVSVVVLAWTLNSASGAVLRRVGFERWVQETVKPAVQRKLDERFGDERL